MLYLKEKHETLFFFVLIFVLSVLWSFHVLNSNFIGDSWKLLTANQIFNSHKLSYWAHIFSHPNHGFVQYRPFSIFAYPFIARFLFGIDPIGYYGVGIFLYALSCSLLFLWIFRVLSHRLAAAFGVLVFMLHPAPESLLHDMSHHFKYFIPLICLLIALIYGKKEKIKVNDTFIIASLFLISILSHEGSVTFAVVFLFYAFLDLKKFRVHHLVLFLPLITYLLIRVFIFKIPHVGFMEVDFLKIPESIFYFFNQLWLPFAVEEGGKFISIPLFLFGSLTIFLFSYFTLKRKNYTLLISFFLSLLLLLPFASVFKHLFSNRVCWAVIFVSLFSAYLFKFIYLKKNGRIWAVFIFLILAFIFKENGLMLLEHRFETEDFTTNVQNSFFESVEKKLDRLEKRVPVEIEVTPLSNTWVERVVLAGMIATRFPDRKFRFKEDKKRFVYSTYIMNGSYYDAVDWDETIEDRQEVWVWDPYGVKQPIRTPSEESYRIIFLDNSFMKELYLVNEAP